MVSVVTYIHMGWDGERRSENMSSFLLLFPKKKKRLLRNLADDDTLIGVVKISLKFTLFFLDTPYNQYN